MSHGIMGRFLCGVLLLSVALAANAARADIAMVNVGNAGNTADNTGYGSVGYRYEIGAYEVTAGQYATFLNAVDPTGANSLQLYNSSMANTSFGSGISYSGGSYVVHSAFINRPLNFVSWYDAARYTNWLTTGDTEKGVYQFSGPTTLTTTLDHQTAAITLHVATAYFIPTENEWYKAAYHNKSAGTAGTYFDYPTSSDTAPGRDLNDVSGNNANYYGNPFPIQSPYWTTVAGEFQNSDSPYGTFDQGGNVYEWSETQIGSSRRVRGASCHDSSDMLSSSFKYYYNPTNEYDWVGLRVADVPEPGCITMVVSGAVVGLIWLWRRK
jgi:formylglycine-generating enzyme